MIEFHVPQSELARAMEFARRATDNESSRYALGSVALEIDDGRLVVVGTDGRRMHVAHVEIVGGAPESLPESTLIPSKTARYLAKLPHSTRRNVRVAIGEGQAAFHVGRGRDGRQPETHQTPLSAGRFPAWRWEYDKPDRYAARITGDVDDLAQLYRPRGVRVSVNGAVQQLWAPFRPLYGARFETEGECVCELAPAYVTDALDCFDGTAVMEFYGPEAPARIKFSHAVAIVAPLAMEG